MVLHNSIPGHKKSYIEYSANEKDIKVKNILNTELSSVPVFLHNKINNGHLTPICMSFFYLVGSK